MLAATRGLDDNKSQVQAELRSSNSHVRLSFVPFAGAETQAGLFVNSRHSTVKAEKAGWQAVCHTGEKHKGQRQLDTHQHELARSSGFQAYAVS